MKQVHGMIRSKTAFSFEVDDVKLAVSEVLEQLKPLELNAGMLGILTCSYDYIEAGVVKALCAALPFDVVGETTISQAVRGGGGMLMLSLMVLYGEDCRFAGGITADIPEDDTFFACVENAYKDAEGKLAAPAKLVIAFPPLFTRNPGDMYVTALSRCASRAPVFGSICADDQPDNYCNASNIYNGEAYRNAMAFALITGDFEPAFMMASVSKESRLPYKGEITGSKGNLLTGINDMPAVKYMETVGLASNGKIRDGISSIPFLINFSDTAGGDDQVVARALFMTTEENYAVCGGAMPVGASITVGICDKSDVLGTTREILKNIGDKYPGRTALIFSCLGRRLALGADPLAEVEMARDEMSADIDFMLAYSSGEMCPTSVDDGIATNRFHNYTIVACVM